MRPLGVAASMLRHNTFTLSELYQYFDLLRIRFPLSPFPCQAECLDDHFDYQV